jgi:tetratricopeptide (TPR) repeat protein
MDSNPKAPGPPAASQPPAVARKGFPPQRWIRLAIADNRVNRTLNNRWVRVALAKWYGLVVAVFVALAIPLLIVPIGSGPDHWWDAVKSQIGGLVLAGQYHPVLSAFVFILVCMLTYAGYEANQALGEAQTAADRSQRKEDIKEALSPGFDALQQQGERATTAAQGAEAAAIATRNEMKELARHLVQAAPAIPANVAAPTGLSRPVTLVGRDDVLNALMDGLCEGGSIGVFALEGMGGVGKSALAAEAVARLAEDREAFPGGAAWIACEGLTGDEGLAELRARVARAFGLEQVAAQAVPAVQRAALGQALAQRPCTLLALDNVEPGLDARAAIDTLAVTNHTAVLLTARQAVAPEKLSPIVLSPLDDANAATLFGQRLQQADRAHARPNAQDIPLILAVVEAVGGLPLAIELTAAYAGVQGLPLKRIIAQLAEDHLDAAAFRADPARAPAARFDHSWQVLTPTQQRTFAGLSLVAGASFPRDAALAFAKAAPDPKRADDPSERADPEGDVAALVSYALVEPLAGERLRLHPLLREYAAKRLRDLGSSVGERLGDAMVAYWLAYAQAHVGYEGMDGLEGEASGLMGALEWAHQHSRNGDVLTLAGSIGFAWTIRGRWNEILGALEWAGEAAERIEDRREQWWVSDGKGKILGRLGRMDAARSSMANALKLAEELDDLPGQQSAVHNLAILDASTGRPGAARTGFERALEMARQLDDLAAEGSVMCELAVLDRQTGRLEAARTGFERALEIARQLDDLAAEGEEVHSLAVLDRQTGRLEAARAGYERALELARQLGDPAAERSVMHNLAVLDAETGRLEAARAGYERALELARQLGDPAAERDDVHDLALLDRQTGRLAEAEAGYERALELAQQVGDPRAESVILVNFGYFSAEQLGDPERGRKLILNSLAISDTLNNVYNAGKCHQFLAWIDEDGGNLENAVAHYREALRRFVQVQSPDAERVREDLRALGVDPDEGEA